MASSAEELTIRISAEMIAFLTIQAIFKEAQ
jgi:hypothetical protein